MVQQSQLCCFSHTYIASTPLKTCRPTHAPPVKVWWCPSCLSHAVNVRHHELSSVCYTGWPTLRVKHQWWPSNGRQLQAAHVRSRCIQPVTIGLTTADRGGGTDPQIKLLRRSDGQFHSLSACMPHTEKQIRHRLSSCRCNMKRRRAAYHVTGDFKGMGY